MKTEQTKFYEILQPTQELHVPQEEISTLLHSKNQELEEILRNIDQIIWYIDIKTLSLQYVNDAIEPIFGFPKESFLADHTLWQQQIHADDRPLVRSFFETLSPGTSQEIRFRIHHSNGKVRWLNSRIHHNEKLHLFIGITRDITESKHQAEEIEFLAYHDPLTMLPNRSKLKLQLSSRLEHSATSPFALVFIDLDNFKNINDTMGHEIGDQILVEVSNRLRTLTTHLHLPSRFGGDEFVVLFNSSERTVINEFSNQLIQTFKYPFMINDIPFFLSSSIGISLYPEDAKTSDDLIKHADTAMYEAKKNGDILSIGKKVLIQACEFIETIRSIYHEAFYVAINVSAKQLHQSNFAEELLLSLTNRSIPAEFLKGELTESVVMDNITIATRQLQILKQGGIKISLDDFGIGYSSFAYLTQLPISTLKIDKSFVQTINEDNSHRHIIEAISNLANILGMSVTAEGIETDEQFNFLSQYKIDTLQGFLFSKPITKRSIYQKLTSQTPYFIPEPTLAFAI